MPSSKGGKSSLRQAVASAVIPCGALLVGLFISNVFPLGNSPNPQHDHILNLVRHEYNGTTSELQRAVAAMAQEGKAVKDLKIQLEGAIAQLKAAQDALVAETVHVAETARAQQAQAKADDATAAESGNPLRDWFNEYKKGPGADKWSGYLDAYHTHFQRFRGQDKVTFVEVGVQSGGSIEMWRSYFGADKLNYIGVDVNANCKKFEKEGVRIVLGDQGDPAFWEKFREDFPEPIDIFLDDGGHIMAQQVTTVEEMFWHVRNGGVYVCEDLHTSYWPDWGGGYLKSETMVEHSKALVDALNSWHSRDDQLKVNEWSRNIRGLHFYDSMVFIDKQFAGPMTQIKAGDAWIPY